MKILSFKHMGLISLILLVSCTADEDRERQNARTEMAGEQISTGDPGRELEVVRGHYVFGHEVRTLRPCDTDQVLWVVDQTQLLQKLHTELTSGNRPYQEVFVVASGRVGPPLAEGFATDYSGIFTVEEVFYVAAEGFGCDFDWGRFQYRAQGNEPFWTLEVLSSGMRLTRPGMPGLEWQEVRQTQTADAVIFSAGGGDLSAAKLVIEPSPSRDTMSGAYYGLSSRLFLNGETYRGHALRGTGSDR